MRENARRWSSATVALVALLAACTSTTPDAPAPALDGSVCALRVTLGMGDHVSFVPLADGDTVPIVLGEQGLLMVALSLEIAGSSSDRIDVAWRTVSETGVAIDQHDRYAPVVTTSADTGVLERWILFYEGTLAPELMDRSADLELTARSAGCEANAHVRLALHDIGR